MVVAPIWFSYVQDSKVLPYLRVVVTVEVYLSAAWFLVGGADGPIFIILREDEPCVDRV